MKGWSVEERSHLLALLDCYGSLLSQRQNEVLNDYFSFDLSLSEIAQNRKVTRSAVEDALLKGVNKLVEYENLLHLLDKKAHLKDLVDKGNQHELEEYIKHGI
jgi:predicted DNA-binding protein YlxM (UPF0122 family)